MLMDDLLQTNPLRDQLLMRANRAAHAGSPKSIRKVSTDFEALFANILMSQMRGSLAPGGFFGSGAQGEIFQSMMDQYLGQIIAKRRQLGIAQLVENYLNRRSGAGETPDQLGVRTALVRSSTATSTQGKPSDERFARIIQHAVRETGLAASLIRSVIEQESGFNPALISAKGAQGLMQLMPGTAAELGVGNVFDPSENILAGSRYLKQMIDRFGSLELGLAAYNAGPGNVEKYGGMPPFPETRQYVRQVLQRMKL